MGEHATMIMLLAALDEAVADVEEASKDGYSEMQRQSRAYRLKIAATRVRQCYEAIHNGREKIPGFVPSDTW